ncbi:MAG TPA: LacI family DNA-binding transcriptional regulator [Fimbriimonadaceae bacterium]|nr:LacI family DNA-binding transcriptional regulator [Fimbriimonadaceae bacterium]
MKQGPEIRTVTLRDVADKANVSAYTVSVVLNGAKSNTRVSDATRERIQKAAVEMGYRPNALARALKRRSTNILGLYFGYGHLEPHDPFHAEVLTGLQRGCEACKKDLMIHYSFHRYSVEQVFAELAGRKIDGLVLIAAPSDPLVELVRDSNLAVVAMTDAIEGIPSVVADDASGSRSIAEHLHDRGHRTILYRACPGVSDSAARRQEAFVRRACELGMKTISARTSDWKGRVEDEEAELLSRRRELGITAAVCWGDPSANALLRYCRAGGIRVPDDLAIVGFNGIEPAVEPAQVLTTVRASWSNVAERAVHLLVNRLGGEDVPSLTVLPVEFYIGDTT